MHKKNKPIPFRLQDLSPTIEKRFWKHVQIVDGGCWPWTGGKHAMGYGLIRLGGKDQGKITTHRLSWAIAHGEVPEGLCVLHKCDNTKCVNPDHLFLGTYADNNADKVKKGRARGGRNFGTTYGLILKKEQIPEVRKCLESGLSRESVAQQFGISVRTVRRIIHRTLPCYR